MRLKIKLAVVALLISTSAWSDDGHITSGSTASSHAPLGAMFRLKNYGIHKFHLNLGVSLLTGSTDERDDTPALANALLPYTMQLGSGTFDVLTGATYNARQG